MEQIRLDLIPNGIMPNVHASQFDKSRTVRFNLYEGDTPFTLLATDNVKVTCNGVEDSTLATAGTSHDWTIPDSVVADSGIFIGELSVERGSKTIGSKNFVLNVEEDAYDGIEIEEKTATGAIATFETNLQDVLTECVCTINPVQDLHGYTKPWSGGAGKNKVDFPSYAQASSNGLTIQTTGNGGFKVTGTPSASWAILTSQIDVNIPSGQAITFGITGGTLSHNVYLNLTYADSTTDTLLIHSGNTSKTMTLAKNLIKVRLDFSGMSTSTNYNDNFYPMLEYGSTQSAFEPYSNICPISGFSGANIVVADENMVAQSTTNITFGQTVYGGVLDVTNGKLTITHVGLLAGGNIAGTLHTANNGWAFTLGDLDAIYKPFGEATSNINVVDGYQTISTSGFCYAISSKKPLFFLSDSDTGLTASSTFAEIQTAFTTFCNNNSPFAVYELDTPIEITLTPKQIEAIVGINNVFHDCNGEIEVKYLVEV